MPYDDQVKPGSVNTVPNKPDGDKKAFARENREDKPGRSVTPDVDDSEDTKPRKRR
jgi:hypothetical protein